MKLIILILITTLMQVSAATFAQKVTLKENGLTMERMFKEIRKQTGYNVIMDNSKLIKSRINANFEDTPLNEVMNFLVKGTDFTFTIEDKVIVIKERTMLDKLSTVISNIVRDLTVKGRVVDQEGKPLPNASIRVKGKSAVTNTNQNGEFEIKGVDEDAVLLVSYVGFKTLEISLKDAVMPLEIKLNVATGELEEVNVTYSTGYQNIPKERATGSFVQIDNELFNRTVSTNVLDRITNITSSLKKDRGTEISIRGLSTIRANKRPLIVVDGFPYEGEDSFIGSILNPNDIENITILRDAAAASIWGARASNGVIVITTKRGGYNQKTKVGLVSNLRIVNKPDLFEANIMSSKDAIEYEKRLFASGMYNEYDDSYPSLNYYPIVSPVIEILLANRRKAITQVQANEQLSELANHDVRNDVDKYLLRKSLNQQYSLSINGGGDKMNYYSSIGYDKNLSNIIGNENDRLTLNLNNTYRPIKDLEVNSYIVYTQSKSKNNGINTDNFIANGSKMIAPYTILANAQGQSLHVPLTGGLRTAYIDTLKVNGILDWHYRPIEEVANNSNNTNLFNVRFGAGLKYHIIPGIDVNLTGQYEKSIINIDNHYSVKNYLARGLINQFMVLNSLGKPQYPVPLGDILDYSNQVKTAYNLRATSTLNKIWGKHAVSGIGGVEISQSQSEASKNRKYGYDPLTLAWTSNMDFNTRFVTRPMGNGFIPNIGDLSGNLSRFLSYYGNVAYTLSTKYTLTASARIDASNFFGINANLKRVPLWSIGGLWDVKKEDFLSLNAISSLKLRATYGFTGNLDNTVTSLPTISYNNGFTPYNNSQQYASRSTPPNPGLTWEKVKMINFGMDIGIFNGRLLALIDYYKKTTNDLIGSALNDPTSGISQYTGNYAGLRGEGFDLQINAQILTGTVRINSKLNLSYNTDKVTKLYLSSVPTANDLVISPSTKVGDPLQALYSYKWGGLNPINGDPMGIINGQVVPFSTVLGRTNGQPNTNPEDLVYHGRTRSPYFGNLLNYVSYRGISASFNVGYAFGYYFRNQSINYSTIQTSWGAHGDYAKRWQKPGDEFSTNVPSSPLPLVPDTRYNFYGSSEILVEKGDHIRLNDVRLSYDLNRGRITRLPFNDCSIFIYANDLNVILWRANNKGIDPNYPGSIPNSSSIAFGLRLNY